MGRITSFRGDHKLTVKGGSYTSDIICRNTVFHVELVHHRWVKIAHQNFQGLIRMLVLPKLWQVQSKKVPGEAR